MGSMWHVHSILMRERVYEIPSRTRKRKHIADTRVYNASYTRFGERDILKGEERSLHDWADFCGDAPRSVTHATRFQ